MSQEAPAEPVFAKDIDERIPQPEKEEGEWSEGEEQRLEAGTSQLGHENVISQPLLSQSEAEIDQAVQWAKIEKLQCLNDVSSPIVIDTPIIPTQNSCKNMLDPDEYRALGITSSDTITEDSEDLRVAALKSMKVNGPEDGEIRSPHPVLDERPTTPGRTGLLGDRTSPPRRPAALERFRVEDSTPLDRPRQRSSRDSPPRSSSRAPYTHGSQQRASSDKRKSKTRWTAEEKKTRRGKRAVSPYRASSDDRRRDRRERNRSEERRRNTMLLSPESSAAQMRPFILQDMMSPLAPVETVQNVEKGKKTPQPACGQQTTSAEYTNMVLGNQQPPASSIFCPRDVMPQSRDNHDLVAMDVSTTPEPPARPSTPFGPVPSASMTSVQAKTRRRSLDPDETALRTMLLEQVKRKRVATPNEEPREMAEGEKYLKNKAEMLHLETSSSQRLDMMRQLAARKHRLLEEIEAVTREMTSCQEEFWKEKERKDALRPLVEEYESGQMLGFGLDDSFSLFYNRIEQETSQLKDVTLSAHHAQLKITTAVEPTTPSRSAIAVQTSPTPTTALQTEQAAISSTSAEQEMDVGPTDENEIQLRQILLQKQKSKTTPAVTSSSPEKAATAPKQPTTPQAKLQYSPHSPEVPSSPINFAAEENEPIDLWTVIKGTSFPIRLLPHAGIRLPHALEACRELCSFDVDGKCKNVECLNRHIKDSEKLELREIVSMILWGAPQLSGSGRIHDHHSDQVDHVLKKKESGEDEETFIRRILRPLLKDSGLLELGLNEYMVA